MQKAIYKTTTVVIVLAMMLSIGATFFPNVVAGDPTVTGTVKSAIYPFENVQGATVTYHGDSDIWVNGTTGADGSFSILIAGGLKENFNLTFTANGYKERTDAFNTSIYDGDIASTNVTGLEPLPKISGIVRELGTTTGIGEVTVTIKNQTDGAVIIQLNTSVNGQFSQYVDATLISLYYKKPGYYDNANESITLTPHTTTNIGYVYLEKVVPTPTIRVWGVVRQNGTDVSLSGAVVSIHKGDEKWITAVTNAQGAYEMLTYAGSFQVKASLAGYYTNISDDWLSVPSVVKRDIFLDKTPTEWATLAGNVTDPSDNGIPNAEVVLHSNDGRYVKSTITNDTGNYTMTYYDSSSFTLEVKHPEYYTNASREVTAADNSSAGGPGGPVNVILEPLPQPLTLHGFVGDSETTYPIVGASLVLYDKNHLYKKDTRTIELGYYEFNAHAGTSYVMIVDADGYQSMAVDLGLLTQNTSKDVSLIPSQKNITSTTFTFVNWTTINVMQNRTIIVDNVTTRADAELKYGMGTLGLTLANWILTQTEVDSWTSDLERKGLEEKLTTDFLTLDNKHFKVNESLPYDVTITDAVTSPSSITNTVKTILYINSSYQYIMDGELEDENAIERTLVLNASYDDSTTNYSYNIILPLTPTLYEMTANSTETINVDVTGYNNPIMIDPKENAADESETVRMTIKTSLNGTAKGKITNGLYYELNNTYNNYTVIVRMSSTDPVNTSVTFSAADSNDPIGDITKANYSWDFESDGVFDAWGIVVVHNFSAAAETKVLLKILETGGNDTWQNLTVRVDGIAPNANIAVDTSNANVTFDSGSNTLSTNEDLAMVFNGMAFSDVEGTKPVFSGTGNSTDGLYVAADALGIIEKWYWAWGEDGVQNETVTKEGSNNITHTYSTPGTYTLIMNVTDVVGHVSSNALWTVVVKDITAPVPAFTMANSTESDLVEAVENLPFTFNASTSTDNFDEVANIIFDWDFENDGTIDASGAVVNFTFPLVGDYNVTLVATDSAGNHNNLTKTIHSSIGERPNLFMKFGTMKFSEATGIVGKDMTISVNLTNDGQVDATDVSVKFYIRNEDGTDTELTGTVTLISITSNNETISDGIISAGENVTATITWTPDKKGNYSLWANSSTSGEHESQYWDNKIDDFDVQHITVNQAGWVMPVIIIVVVVVIVVVFLGMRYFMRSKTETETDEGKRLKK